MLVSTRDARGDEERKEGRTREGGENDGGLQDLDETMILERYSPTIDVATSEREEGVLETSDRGIR